MENKKTNWSTGYVETKNFIHNELGLTKENIKEMIAKMAQEELEKSGQLAREELLKIISGDTEYIRSIIKDVVREEIKNVLIDEHYPSMRNNVYIYDKNASNPYNKFISDIVKEEVISTFRNQFEVGINIKETAKPDGEEQK